MSDPSSPTSSESEKIQKRSMVADDESQPLTTLSSDAESEKIQERSMVADDASQPLTTLSGRAASVRTQTHVEEQSQRQRKLK